MANTDIDPIETLEWLHAIEDVHRNDGTKRAHFLVDSLIKKARDLGVDINNQSVRTPYKNTILAAHDLKIPGDLELEQKIRGIIRWNALAIVLRASKKDLDLGGHIASFASSATLYDIGFNHFWRGPNEKDGGDLIYFQGHISPGIYARSFLEGRFSKEQLDNFRQEVGGKGISSYPHPKLMPDYWQFPTVSMGLGPLQAIYQARFLKYLTDRDIKDCTNQKVWVFLGDGEIDEPESLGAIGLAAREKLDNLIFVVNCNLQRLDGPVRGNAKIIQELEGTFKGAGWEVIKLIWGRYWDELLAKDTSGKLQKLMDETVDGEFQNFKAKGGAYTREHFFGKYPETKELVANMSDDDIWRLNRGGHDPIKVYTAYSKAINSKDKPTVILAKTVKGYGMGEAAEGKNVAHQVKKMPMKWIKHFRDRFNIPVSDNEIEEIPYYKPDENSPEIKYLKERREKLNGFIPQRRVKHSENIEIPALSDFKALLDGSERVISTTMAFNRVLQVLLKKPQIGKIIVPIVPDEARTFGMEGLFRQVGIYAHEGQKYIPQDAEQVAYYKESKTGSVLQEGINEGGAMASWMAAATSYSVNNTPMIPFYIYYSMFGFQRIGDLAWAAGDMRARGFLIGATSGRTTLNGEGLQHEDGHSHILAGTIPNCISYDPTFTYELAVIIQKGLERMYGQEQEDIFYYITTLNENYAHPKMPQNAEYGILKGAYKLKNIPSPQESQRKVQLLGSGSILNEVIKAAEILANDYHIHVDLISATSFNELARDGEDCQRYNMLNPSSQQKNPHITELLEDGLVTVAATDYMKNYAEQIRKYINGRYKVLGTDGFGRSDSRENLRTHFEVNYKYIILATLYELSQNGQSDADEVNRCLDTFKIDPNKINPLFA